MKIMMCIGLLFAYSCHGISQQSNAQNSQMQEKLKKQIVRFPYFIHEKLYEVQNDYCLALLQLVLEKSQLTFEIESIYTPSMPQVRSASLLENEFYDIHWMVSNKERESLLAPIRIPLYKGLFGLRLALVNKKTPNILANINTIEQLRKLVVGQGRHWVDSQILQINKFNLFTTTSDTTALYDLLNMGRIDYFPRSIVEIWNEQKALPDINVTVDKHIALYYRMPVYFFVRKNDHQLYRAIEKGLQKAIADGSFEKLFEQYFGHFLSQAKLSERHVFKLDNPFLPKKTPTKIENLWIKINEENN